MKFLNDEYTLQIDDLGYKSQVDTIRELIVNSETPFSIGISGRWGSGKTSTMKYLMASLGGEPLKHRIRFHTQLIEESSEFDSVYTQYKELKDCEHVHTIWFNPWENENHKEPMVALLQEIYNHFSYMSNLSNKLKKISSVTFQAGLDLISALKEGSGHQVATNIKNIGEQYEHENFQYMDRGQRFKLIFQDAIEKLLTTKKRTNEYIDPKARIVIFVDDLDRCEDETVSKLLKEIKQYLSSTKCIFVFGYDRHHIEKSLSKTETKTNKETRAYLEKLFQTTFYIKEAKSNKLNSFATKILQEYGEYIDQANINAYVEFIINIIDSNPRRLKSYLITLYFHIKNSSFYDIKPIVIDDFKKLSLIAYLKLFYESVYTALENRNSMLNSIVSVCKDKDRGKIDNAEKYFVYLEFLSHLHTTDVSEFLDKELRDEIVKNSNESEEKFLNEIYQMQGKHTSFDNFREEFARLFQSERNIEKYL